MENFFKIDNIDLLVTTKRKIETKTEARTETETDKQKEKYEQYKQCALLGLSKRVFLLNQCLSYNYYLKSSLKFWETARVTYSLLM